MTICYLFVLYDLFQMYEDVIINIWSIMLMFCKFTNVIQTDNQDFCKL